ncbi:MAG TPA: histidinol dehydrogenase [Candidatus Cybelea sp.]|jgi:histidinol dehydrogenase|nr:histidinol dehydrogenase [Candidatus Cybelea sp.]
MIDASARLLKRLAPGEIAWPASESESVDVGPIVQRVRLSGDFALRAIASELGDAPFREVTREEIAAAYRAVTPSLRQALEAAAARIERFAQAQRAALSDVSYEVGGMRVGHRAVAIESAGIYVPSGRHPLPSSLLMGVIPARVAGVERVIACTARAVPEILAAAYVAGVDRLFQLGGAQAIAALAFGTESVPKVDLIAGAGNAYVTAAKRMVFGACGIDALAGPSEVVVIAASDARAEWVAADLLAQAEHDPGARAMLLTDDAALADAVERALEEQLRALRTAATARAALERSGCCAVLPLRDAIAAANVLAPEHLELHGERAESLAVQATAYGSLFVGSRSAEAFGDYGIGPNHVLPTSGSARYTGGLSVFTFLNARTFVEAIGPIDPTIAAETAELAACEGLDAHRRAVCVRGAW